MQRVVLSVAFGLIVLLAGCDRLFGITHIDPQPPDAPAVPDAPAPTTELVQQTTSAGASSWMLAATLPQAPVSGNVLVAIGATDRANLMPPTGGGVANWMLAGRSSTYMNVEIWYGISDGSDSIVTIKCDCALTTLGNMRLSVSEWAGLASNVFEVGNGAAGASMPGPASASAITTLDSPDLLVFAVAVNGTVASDATGGGTWTALDPVVVAPGSQSQWYQLVPAPGSYMPTVMVNGYWDAAIAAFRAMR